MLRHKLTVLALIAAGSIACISVASAQTSLEINPFAGYYIASDIYNGYGTGGSGNVELTNSFMYGGRLTWSSPRGGFEFAYTRTGSDAKLHNALSGQPAGSDKVGRIDFDNYDINFLGYQPSGNPRVTPFGLIGFGWAVTHPKIDNAFAVGAGATKPKSNTLFNFNFGLGVRVAMNEKIATRFEARWRVTDTNLETSSGLWCDPFGYCYSYSSNWYDAGELEAGISYSFK